MGPGHPGPLGSGGLGEPGRSGGQGPSWRTRSSPTGPPGGGAVRGSLLVGREQLLSPETRGLAGVAGRSRSAMGSLNVPIGPPGAVISPDRAERWRGYREGLQIRASDLVKRTVPRGGGRTSRGGTGRGAAGSARRGGKKGGGNEIEVPPRESRRRVPSRSRRSTWVEPPRRDREGVPVGPGGAGETCTCPRAFSGDAPQIGERCRRTRRRPRGVHGTGERSAVRRMLRRRVRGTRRRRDLEGAS